MRNLKFLSSLILIIFISLTGFSQSIKLDKKLGKKNFDMIMATMDVNTNKSMNEYLNKVGQRLVSNLDSALFEYQFFILNDPNPNAFAIPGGYIFVTSGIIPLLENEDELAGIIGHEIIHSNNRHSVRQLRKKILPTILILPINILGATVPGLGAITSPINTTQSLLFASYSRKFETEADEQGVILAAKSGYNPLALPKALNRLMKEVEYLTGEKEKKNYFADHPYTPNRDKKIKALTKELNFHKEKPISPHFLHEFDGIIFGHSPAKGIVKNNIFLHPVHNYRVEFPKTWRVLTNDSVVSAYSPHKDAAFSLLLEKNNLSPEEASKEYLKQLSKSQKKLVVKSGEYRINNIQAYKTDLQEIIFSDTSFASVIWLPIGKKLFRISTFSDFSDNNTIESIVKSIRTLQKEEKESIKIQYVTLTKAKAGETLEELSKRTNNLIKPELTAIINGVEVDDKLKKDEDIKIVLEKPFIKYF